MSHQFTPDQLAALAATLRSIQAATLAMRARTGDNSLGTRVSKGRLQVVRVTDNGKRRACTVTPVTDWVPVRDAVAAIDGVGA